MQKNLVLIVLSASLAVLSCGKKKDSTDTPANDGTGTAAADTGTASGSSLSGTDEATDSVADGSSSSGVALTDAEPSRLVAGDKDITVTRVCTLATDGTGIVTVKVTRTGSGTLSGTQGKNRTYTNTIAGTGDETRVWTPPTGQTTALACSTNNSAKVPWKKDAVVDGLTVSNTVNNTMTRTRVITNTKTNTTTTVVDNNTAKGLRTITWAKGTSDATTVTHSKKVVIKDMIRTKDYTNKSGEQKSISTTTNTATASPLAITVVRNATTGILVSKLVNSGVLNIVNADGTTTQLTLSSVKFDLASTNTDVCRPVSGTVTGTVTDKGATTASQTFTITYDSSSDTPAVITFDKGVTSEEYQHNGRGCDLERES